MSETPHDRNIGALSLDELRLLRNDHAKGLEICFQSNGSLVELNNPYATYAVGDMEYVIVGGGYPPWVTALIALRHDIPGKHFRIKLSTAHVDAYKIEIIEECLDVLNDCDIFRDGGSYEATWLTNYGRKWKLFLQTSRERVFAEDHTKRHTYLYNCSDMETAQHSPILKMSAEDKSVMNMLNAWMDKPSGQLQTNRRLMESYSRFNEMYNRIPWRMY